MVGTEAVLLHFGNEITINRFLGFPFATIFVP